MQQIPVDPGIGREILIRLLNQAWSEKRRPLPSKPCYCLVAVVIPKESVQPPRIDIHPVMGEDHGGRGNGTSLSPESPCCVPQGIPSPSFISLEKLRHGNHDFSGNR